MSRFYKQKSDSCKSIIKIYDFGKKEDTPPPYIFLFEVPLFETKDNVVSVTVESGLYIGGNNHTTDWIVLG